MGSAAFTVTFDCADPHRQAAFWAAALAWTVEDHATFIGGLQEAGHLSAEDVIHLDGVAVFKSAAVVRDPGDPVDEHSGMGRGADCYSKSCPNRSPGRTADPEGNEFCVV